MHSHEHSCVCSHENVRYCKHCNTVYCLNCNQEWGHKSYYWYNSYPYTYTQYGSTANGSQSIPNTQAALGQALSSTACQHGS